jgi:hypothetical protein
MLTVEHATANVFTRGVIVTSQTGAAQIAASRAATSPGADTTAPRALESISGTIASRQTRLLVLRAYSQAEPTCACCAESTLGFLTRDHLKSGGRAHRRQYSGTLGVYRELKRRGFPPGYRVLCFNCNLARGSYGTCPHEGPRTSAESAIRSELATGEIFGGRRCTRCKPPLPASPVRPRPPSTVV